MCLCLRRRRSRIKESTAIAIRARGTPTPAPIAAAWFVDGAGAGVPVDVSVESMDDAPLIARLAIDETDGTMVLSNDGLCDVGSVEVLVGSGLTPIVVKGVGFPEKRNAPKPEAQSQSDRSSSMQQ